ncbi:hypothetical protein PSTT_02753 [Puccinia striiformis]|uniref:Uncharacterized protein n=2 Tax=Puccinia striiformis TaxID=27350 RepID=A0A0L0VXT7_9BASI|nr:hypothetical protein PSTG_02697 [Puccinia striiformis f. sp. tritici PST-78]POW14640.1 hypothetical protein PSTT_02753 [Puccinia striiformis]
MFGKLAAFPPFFYILGEYLSPARDTRSASRSRSDFLNIDHQRFADPSTTVRSTKQGQSISILFPKSIIRLNGYQGFNQH